MTTRVPFRKVVKAWELSIVNRDHWLVPDEKTDAPAVLDSVCWLEVCGSVPLWKDARYQISFKLGLDESRADSWKDTPIFFMAKIGSKGKYRWMKKNISELGTEFNITMENQVELKYSRDLPGQDRTLYFGIYEVWKGNWKHGLKIYEVIVEEVTPSANEVAITVANHEINGGTGFVPSDF